MVGLVLSEAPVNWQLIELIELIGELIELIGELIGELIEKREKKRGREKTEKKRGRPLIIRFKRVILDFADAHFKGDTPQLGHGAVRPAWSGFPALEWAKNRTLKCGDWV